MEGVVRWLADLVPRITHPIALIAYAVFVVVFLLNRVVIASGLLRQVGKSETFAILNKILNVAGLALLLIILLAFGAYIYSINRQTVLRSKDVRIARHYLAELADAARTIKTSGKSLSLADQWRLLVSPIYNVGQVLDTDLAIAQIREQRELHRLDSITPALLAVSPDTLESMLTQPFDYVPAVFRPKPHYIATANSVWSIERSAEGTVALEYLLRLEHQPNVPFKDIVYFLAGTDPESWDKKYDSGLVLDAAYYVPIRRALMEGRFSDAARYAGRFIDIYAPQAHRHVDDAFVLQVMALECARDLEGALRSIRNGLKYTKQVRKRAGRRLQSLEDEDPVDMEGWLDAERIIALEMFESFEGLSRRENEAEWKDLKSLIRFTEAHHLMARKDYKKAIDAFKRLGKSDLCPSATAEHSDEEKQEQRIDAEGRYEQPCIPRDTVMEDIQKAEALEHLWKDKSVAGRYRYALAVYDDELVHYNSVVAIGRSDWRRPPELYFRERNNYYIAAESFRALLADPAATPELKQLAGYKLGRCLEHLARPSSFFVEDIEGRDRQEFARASAEAFEQAARVAPEGALADDALTEAAVHRYVLFRDAGRAFVLLDEVRNRYKGRNAEDEATLWFARIASLNNDGTRAEEAWQALEEIAKSARVRARMEDKEAWLTRWQEGQ